MPGKLRLTVLGRPHITLGGAPVIGFTYRKSLALLIYLAVTGRSHSRDALIGLLWPETTEANARSNLRKTLTDLRRHVAPFLDISRHEVAFDPDSAYELDVAAFEAGVADTSQPDISPLQEAVDLYRGDFLEGFYVRQAPGFEEWTLSQRARLREHGLQALHALAVYYAGQGPGGLAPGIDYATRLLALEPWREEAHRQLMRLLALNGQRGAALAQYENCRQVLAAELGVEPGPETTALYEQIRDGELRANVDKLKPSPLPRHRPALPGFLQGEGTPVVPERPLFVARENELNQLIGLLKRMLAGQGQVAFVIGEPGSGKTLLVSEFVRRALDRDPDLVAAVGNCNAYGGVGDPYLPFREILAVLTGDVEDRWRAGAISREHARRLWALLPHAAQALVSTGPDLLDIFVSGQALRDRAMVASPDGAAWLTQLEQLLAQTQARRARPHFEQADLFGMYTKVLRALAQHRPIILVLDDLQWADAGSLSLLFHLGRRLGNARVLVVGAYRPEEVAITPTGDPHPLQELLAEFQRQFGDVTLDLTEADATGGLRFVQALLDTMPNRLSADFRRALHRHTGGHPLFTIELLHAMQERGDLVQNGAGLWVEGEALDWVTLPARVEAVIGKRVERLDQDLRDLLTVASVEGETFTAEVVARVLDVDPGTLVGRLSGELVKGHRLLEAQGMRRLGAQRLSRYRFRHNLFQKYLYSRLDEVERAHRHEGVGKALQTLCSDQADEIAVQLAWHFQKASIPELAVAYLHRAGERAMRLAANEEAADHLRQGLALLEALPRSPEGRQQQLELQLTLGHAERNAGRIAEALETFQRTADIARELGSAEGLARAALGYEQSRWRVNLPAEPSARLLTDALGVLGEEESVLRVRVWVSRVRALWPTSSPEQFAAMSRQAVEMARRVGDATALYEALHFRLMGERRPEESAERLAAVEKLFRLAPEVEDSNVPPLPYTFRILENLELGDIQAVQADHDEFVQMWKELRQPVYDYFRKLTETMLALLVGCYGEGERFAQQALDTGRQLGIENVDGTFGIQMFTLRREQGRLRELAPVVKTFVERDSAGAAWRPGLALLYSELDLRPEAREQFEILAAGGFVDLARDALWSTSIVYLAEVCAYLGDADRAGTLYRLLLPYAGRNVVTGPFAVCHGAAARYLGLLAATMGRWTQAEGHFEAALEMNTKLGARPWLAHTQHQYATMLLTRDQLGDRDRAMSLLEEALGTARELGMAPLVERIRALGY